MKDTTLPAQPLKSLSWILFPKSNIPLEELIQNDSLGGPAKKLVVQGYLRLDASENGILSYRSPKQYNTIFFLYRTDGSVGLRLDIASPNDLDKSYLGVVRHLFSEDYTIVDLLEKQS